MEKWRKSFSFLLSVECARRDIELRLVWILMPLFYIFEFSKFLRAFGPPFWIFESFWSTILDFWELLDLEKKLANILDFWVFFDPPFWIFESF